MRTPAASPVPPVQKSQVDEPASYAEGPPGRTFEGSILSYSKNCPCIGLCSPCSDGPPIQTKFAISQPGDALEPEVEMRIDWLGRSSKTEFAMPPTNPRRSGNPSS